LKKQKPEEVSLQDMMTNEAYAPTQHDRDVFARCVGDFLVKILNKPPSFEVRISGDIAHTYLHAALPGRVWAT